MERTPIKDVVKFEDSFLTIKHYKEPLKKVDGRKGYGYFGCLLSTTDGKLVQCHICGKLFGELQAHVRQSHDITANEYRDIFQLAKTTSLISDEERIKRKMIFVKMWENMSEEERSERKKKWIEWTKKGHKKREANGHKQAKEALETKNKKGTCPDQLLDKVKKCHKDLGHVPSMGEFMEYTGGQRYKHLIIATFGSWANALKMIKLEPRKSLGGKGKKKKQYTDEELIEYLQMFARENNKIPTSSDCKRGYLPSEDAFNSHFGSLVKARAMAKINEILK